MQQTISRKTLWQIPLMHALFGVLFAMAVVLYKERLFVDCGYYLFHAINDQFFHVEHHRYVLAISQLLPLAGVYLGASLKTVLVLYSLNHVLFYYVLFVIVVHRFNNIAAGIALLLLQTIGQLYLYFSPMLEICYGAGLLIPFYVLLNQTEKIRWRWFWLVFLEFLILTSHPENFIIFFFAVSLHVLQNGFQKKLHLPIVVFFFVLMVIKIFSFSEYESNKVHYMMKQDENKLYLNFFSPDYVKGIIHVLYSYFLELIVFFFFTIGFLVKEKKWKIVWLFIFTVVGTIVLINVTNYANEFSRYRESLYNPLVPVIVVAFISLLYNRLSLNWRIPVFVLLVLIITHRIYQIFDYSKPFSQRIVQMENIIEHAKQKAGSKFLVNLTNCERKNWQLNWSYSLETMMLSSLDGKRTITVGTDEDIQNLKAALPLTDQTSMITRWDIRSDQSFNKKYFHLDDGKYFELNNRDTLVNTDQYIGKINLKMPDQLSLKKNKIVYVPVHLFNSSNSTLFSGSENGVFLSCHWLEKKSGSMRRGSRTPLEVDIHREYVQVIEAVTPIETGDYLLIVDVVIQDLQLKINASSEVHID